MLPLIPLEGIATGAIIFGKLEEAFQRHELSFEKVSLVATDGAPAIVGRNRGRLSRIKTVAPSISTLHCFSMPCAKLDHDLKEVIGKPIKIINFISGNSATQHCLF